MPSTLLSRQTLNATDLDGLTYGTSLDMEIIGPVFKDGPNITFTGTPEAFYNKVHELNPNYDTDFQDVIAAQGSEDELEGVDATAAKTFCYHDDYASTQPIKNGIKYLNSLSASCGSIRRFCTRVSCSYDSGIYLCNNVSAPISFSQRVSKLLTLSFQYSNTTKSTSAARVSPNWLIVVLVSVILEIMFNLVSAVVMDGSLILRGQAVEYLE